MTEDGGLYRRAVALAEVGRDAEAAELFRRVVAGEPEDGDSWCWLARCELEIARPSLALAAADRAAAAAPDWDWPHRLRARALAELGREEDALAAARRAAALDPDSLDPMVARAWFAANAGVLDEAVSVAQAAVEQFPNDGNAWFALGRSHQAASHWEQAETAYRKAVELEPEEAMWANNLAWVLNQQGRFSDARVWAERSLALDPSNRHARGNLGVALRCLGDERRGMRLQLELLEENLRDAEAALRVNPRDSEAHVRKARVLARLGRRSEELRIARQAVASDRSDARAWAYLATALADVGELDEARNAMHEARKRDPEGRDTMSDQAWLGAVLGEPSGVADAIARTLAERPGDWYLSHVAGYEAAANRDWNEARSRFAAARDGNPTYCCSAVWEGIAAAHQGAYEEARDCLHYAERVNPTCGELDKLRSLLLTPSGQ